MVEAKGSSHRRVAIYLRVSTGEQTTENQRRELESGRRTPRLARGGVFRGCGGQVIPRRRCAD
jgi:hypothetical protein